MLLRKFEKGICAVLVSLTVIGGGADIYAADTVTDALSDTAEFVYNTVANPQVGSVGGEWAVIGLAASGVEIPREYYDNYYKTVENYVTERGGILDGRKYTEYARVAIALTSIGKNPADVAGYNLLAPLEDYEKTVSQGINGAVWALIALDCAGYGTRETREKYIEKILELQLDDGGWSLLSGTSSADADITAMALQALAKYRDDEAVAAAVERALQRMSETQNENGGFSGWGVENMESAAQMTIALCELNIPLNDTRFVKNGKTLTDNLLTYYEEGNGFKHSYEDTAFNQMATEQALCALAAAKRQSEGENSLYNMSDRYKSDRPFADAARVGVTVVFFDILTCAGLIWK